MKRGFSLIELLVTLIIIALITGAFITLVTKKRLLNNYRLTSSNVSVDCVEKFGSNCDLCTDKYCLRCYDLVCPEGEYKDVSTCSCKPCFRKYGDYCKKCDESRCFTCSSSEYLDSSDKICKSCSSKFSNCATCDETKCLSCNAGYDLINSGPITLCTNFKCSGEDFIQIGDLCITKKNMGDGDKLKIPDGVNVMTGGKECLPSEANFCCWQAGTSLGADNSNGGAYSGSSRTLCDWYAADYICEKFNEGGYTWRLPTSDEMTDWADNSKGVGVNGLQLCDDYSGYLSAQCGPSSSCSGAHNSLCRAYYVWSGVKYKDAYAYYYYLNKGTWTKSTLSRTYGVSVRCVSKMIKSCDKRISPGCLTCNGEECLSCDNGYVLVDGVCKVDCESLFGAKCSECNINMCTKCANGYSMGSDPTSDSACGFDCSGKNLMQINNLCVTRRNMGDSAAFNIPAGIEIVSADQECNQSLCCWKGLTSSTYCDNLNGGGYSGCTRTVCTKYAAEKICDSLNIGGYKWRLASRDEMDSWMSYSKNKGVNGLQLCDGNSGYSSARCGSTNNCPGSTDGCEPNQVWTGDNDVLTYIYSLYNGGWGGYLSNWTHAVSVRCVADL